MKCFIYNIADRTNDIVTAFTQDIFTKCQNVSNFRKMRIFNSQDINLNAEHLNDSGFQIKCY